jgi:hypothetical protein
MPHPRLLRPRAKGRIQQARIPEISPIDLQTELRARSTALVSETALNVRRPGISGYEEVCGKSDALYRILRHN